MNRFRKHFFVALVLTLLLALLAPVAYFSPSRNRFETPTDCLSAYYESRQNGDRSTYLYCLTPPLRSLVQGENKARQPGTILGDRAVKNWVVISTSDDQSGTTTILIDEVRPVGISQVRFRLERTGKSWLIADVRPALQKQPSIPFGTDIRTVLGDNPSASEPPGHEEPTLWP